MSARKETTFDRRKREREARIKEFIAKFSTAPRKPFTSEDIDQAMATSYTPIIAQDVDQILSIGAQPWDPPHLVAPQAYPRLQTNFLSQMLNLLQEKYMWANSTILSQLLQDYLYFPTAHTKHLICKECATQRGQKPFEAVFQRVCEQHLDDVKRSGAEKDPLCSMAAEATRALRPYRDENSLKILLSEWLLHSKYFNTIDIGILMHAWRSLTEQHVNIYELWRSVLAEYVKYGTYNASQVPEWSEREFAVNHFKVQEHLLKESRFGAQNSIPERLHGEKFRAHRKQPEPAELEYTYRPGQTFYPL